MKAIASGSPGFTRRALAILGAGWLSSGLAAVSAEQSAALPTFAESPRVITRATGQGEDGSKADVPTVLAVGYSPDGKTLAVAGEDPVVELRDAASNRLRARAAGHTEPVTCLA